MEQVINEIEVNGVKYIKKDLADSQEKALKLDGMKYVCVRTYSAGVFCGYLESRKDREVILRKARRLWYWSGASSLSQLSAEGVKKPDECKFPCEVDRVELLEAIEIIDVTEAARKSISEVKVWAE